MLSESKAWEPLFWKVREWCDQYDGWPVFYQIGSTHLPLYLDMGLALLKFGEEARVDLREFSLEGRNRKELRYAYHRAHKAGAMFEVVPANQVDGIMEELRHVSDEWLKEKDTAKKKILCWPICRCLPPSV
ncbi:MAG: phosphatidylglycerol lysyltransferase domain-containing protein [Nitrospirales bacterium]